jgi:anti-sigma regulatory factor (Ser/Thr protein kinase)
LAVQRRSQTSLELRLQARPEFVPVLRKHIRAWLEDLSASDREIFEVLMATTEAFANAVEHPHEPTSHLVDVEGSLTDGRVTISIRDYGTWQSEQARKEQGGLGLMLMEALMDVVQVECVLDGTTVTMHRHLAMR